MEEHDRHGIRGIDKVHLKPQRARYRWRSFARIIDADDLEPYNAALEQAARRISLVDFDFLKRSLERCRKEATLFGSLTRL